MRTLIVVNKPDDWPLEIPGVEVVPARDYLTDPKFTELRGARVLNLCRSYRYQSTGYYVSLLADARGHRPQPTITTIQDLKSASLARFYSGELDELIDKSLSPLQSNEFTLSIYFGQNMAKRYKRLALELFNLFPAPLLRAEFIRENGGWLIRRIYQIPAGDIQPEHRPFAIEAAKRYFEKGVRTRTETKARYHLAVLWDERDPEPASGEKAIDRFCRAADKMGLETEVITREDFGRLAEFDALFIRETTAVNHHTFRIAQRAEAEGLVVIDDPESILLCSNKVYLAELLARHKLPAPKTIIVHKGNMDTVSAQLGLPCVLKQPDSSFSAGVFKATTQEELDQALEKLLDRSDLVIAQEFRPTEFDWRVVVLGGKALVVCKYYMAPRHWQIINQKQRGGARYGNHDTMLVEDAPPKVVKTALKAAALIGDGLYGVDLKEVGGKVYIVEINDNPNLDAGVEDSVLGKKLYEQIAEVFLQRIEAGKAARAKK